MIFKVVSVQPVFDRHKHDFQKPKDGLKKKESGSFASVLENILKSQNNGK